MIFPQAGQSARTQSEGEALWEGEEGMRWEGLEGWAVYSSERRSANGLAEKI